MTKKMRPRDRVVDDEIENKIFSIDVVRTARIKASGRLYKYSEYWDFMFLVMNVISVALLITSLLPLSINESNSGLMISAFFSLYTMLVQYFCSTLNYNERALKYHYHQLELENFILQLKNLLLYEKIEGNVKSEQEKFLRYKTILEKYQISLQGYENHSDLDYRIARKQIERYTKDDNKDELKNNWEKIIQWFLFKDFTIDNIFIYLQVPIIIFIVFGYIWVAKEGLK
ncbi:SLATT domain-containing protein [Streptococcus pluranimalium]